MKNLFTFIVLAIGILFINNSCTYTTKQDSQPEPGKQEMVRIIPKNEYDKESFPSKMIKRDIKKTGLLSLDNGYDSMFIRLWYTYSATKQVVELRKTLGKWNAAFHSMELGVVDNEISITNTTSIQGYPKSNWNVFTDKLFSLDILNLPDQSDLYNYNVDADGNFVVVEIATKKKYRIYSYSVPYVHLEFPEAVKMENIMKLIEEEFGIKRTENF
jgi:hypothetical protein